MNICVTGASQGLGKFLCQELISRGHRVWGVARSEEKLRDLAQTLGQERYIWSCVDVASAPSIDAWKEAMHAAAFIPDCIVLNASVQQNDMESGYDHQRAGHTTIQVNLEGALQCVEAFLPSFLGRKAGSFLAVTSTVALRPSTRSASYAASKSGLAMAFRSLRLRYAAHNIRFATVCLGPIATEMWEGRRSWLVPPPQGAARAIASFIPTRRSILYYPTLSTLVLRLSLFLSDALFARASSAFLK